MTLCGVLQKYLVPTCQHKGAWRSASEKVGEEILGRLFGAGEVDMVVAYDFPSSTFFGGLVQSLDSFCLCWVEPGKWVAIGWTVGRVRVRTFSGWSCCSGRIGRFGVLG